MTTDQPPKTDADLKPSASTEAQREETRRQIEHRFRHILGSGQVSPLYHLVMRYKLGALP